ncbi:MAG TPA: TraB/GumN family protein [Rhodanobacteraceae bacterium]|nr:TraB/GumN family protein [Rhodanobacteraceae bacterium]
MKMRCLRWLVPILLWSACSQVLADPALWRIQRDGATVYLFGTVHVLPPDVKWHYPALDDALKASSTLYVELVDDDPATMQPLVMQYGIDFAHPLSGELDAGDEQRLQAAAQTAGVPAQALDAMKPWMAAVTLTVAPIVKAGFDPASGADKKLRQQFASEGKPVKGLETAARQIGYFANLPQAVQISMLQETLDDYAKADTEIAALVKDWQHGDVDAIAALENSDMREKYPVLYRTLLTERNQRWAKQIAQMLGSHRTVFIAVGAAHLAGPDDVQAQLQKLGIAVERVH